MEMNFYQQAKIYHWSSKGNRSVWMQSANQLETLIEQNHKLDDGMEDTIVDQGRCQLFVSHKV